MSIEDWRPWISEERESHITDKSLLQRLTDGAKTPFGIAGDGNRVSTVRIQCHYLDQLGYIKQTSTDTYIITSKGEEVVKDSDSFISGYVRVKKEMNLEYEHVTNLGELLDADTIIEINKQFYHSEELDYEATSDSPQDITRVRDARLERLTTEFPRFEPLTNQLAHAVRTFCGHHLFPDANHRTGTHIADILAGKQGYDLFSSIQQDREGIRRAVEISKILRGISSNVRDSVDYLWMKDELFYHWNRYFRDLLYDLEPQKRVHMRTGNCQYSEIEDNERVALIYQFALLPTDDMRDLVQLE